MSSSQAFVAFDLETTGLVPGVDRIIELAALLFDEEGIREEWSTLVDPGIRVPADASRVNRITDAMLAEQPRIEFVLHHFAGLLGRGIPVAHNAAFDVGFLSAALGETGVTAPAGPVIDTRALAYRAFPGRSSYSLGNLSRDLCLRADEVAHRARDDAETCRRLFLVCRAALERRGPLTVDDLVAWSGPLDFAEHAPRYQRTAALLEAARAEGREVEIEYRSGHGETTRRTIRPLSFTRAGNGIAVVAWCSLRGANRTFILDAIVSVRNAPAEAAPKT